MTAKDQPVHVFPGARRADVSGVAPEIADIVEDIRGLGYALIPDYLDARKIGDYSARIDRLYAEQVREFGADNMAAINDEGVCRSLFAYDDVFIDLLRAPVLMKVCRHFFGPVFTLHVQRAVLSAARQQHAAAVWHREPAYQNFTSSVPVALSTIFFLDGSAAENGGVHVLDASHKFDLFPTDSYVRRHEKLVEAPPGSLLVFDSALFHRGGYNSSNDVRRSIVQIYSSPLLKQATDIPHALNGRLRGDPELEMLLGYTTMPDAGDLAYRQRKLRQKAGGSDY